MKVYRFKELAFVGAPFAYGLYYASGLKCFISVKHKGQSDRTSVIYSCLVRFEAAAIPSCIENQAKSSMFQSLSTASLLRGTEMGSQHFRGLEACSAQL